MIELDGKSLEIGLKEDPKGRERVLLSVSTEGCLLQLTPHQARVVATELIMAVNRAEVRSNLRHNLGSKRNDPSDAGRQALFKRSFAE